MPAKKDPQPRHLKEAPRPRHKARPKFDIPVETSASEAPVGWVYRAEEAAPVVQVPLAAAPVHPAVAPRPVERSKTKKSSPENPFLTVGKGLFRIGFDTVGFVSRTALGLMVAPVRLAKWMLTSH